MKKILAFAVVLLTVLFFVSSQSSSVLSYVYDDGYAIQSPDILDHLMNGGVEGQRYSLYEVKFNDVIYMEGSNVYIGENKEMVESAFPLYVNDGSAMRFLNHRSYLINDEFETLPTYDGIYISNGMTFNPDRSLADDENFIFIQLPNGLYINAAAMEVMTSVETFKIKANSILNLTSDQINYVEFEEGELVYREIHALYNTKIRIGEYSYLYTDLLKLLGKVKEQIRKEEKQELVEEVEEEEILPLPNQNSSQSNQKKESETEDKQQEPSQEVNENERQPEESEEEKEEVEEQEQEESEGDEDSSSSWGDSEESLEEEGDSSFEEDSSAGGEDSQDGEEPQGGEEGSLPEGEEKPNDGNNNNNNSNNDNNNNNNNNNNDNNENNEEGNNENQEGGNTETPELPEPTYQEPNVTLVGDFETGVYYAKGKVEIEDPSFRINRGLRFYVYQEGNLIMRKSYRNTDEIKLEVLPPNSELEVSADFRYYNEDGKKETKDIIPDDQRLVIHTQPMEVLPKVNVKHEASKEKYSNQILLKNLQLSEKQAENQESAMEYIDHITIEFSTNTREVISTNINGQTLAALKAGERVDYLTPSILQSNSDFTYRMTLYDRFGNTFVLSEGSENTGEDYTVKEVPKASLQVITNESGKMEMEIKVSDEDGALVNENHRFEIIDMNNKPLSISGKVVENGKEREFKDETSVELSSNEAVVEVNNLPFSRSVTARLSANYQLNSSLSVKNEVIGMTRFYTAAMASGSLYYKIDTSNIGGTSVDLAITLSEQTAPALLALVNEIVLQVNPIKEGESKEYRILQSDLMKELTAEEIENNEAVIATLNDEAELVVSGISHLEEGANAWDSFVDSYQSKQKIKLEVRLKDDILQPSKEYRLKLMSYAVQNGEYVELSSNVSTKNFTTLKRAPEVAYDEVFVGNDYIEIYGLNINDTDGTILNKEVTLRLKLNGTTLAMQSVRLDENGQSNSDIRFENLYSGVEYSLEFIAKEYNQGYTLSTYQSNAELHEPFNFTVGEGVSGSLHLSSLIYDVENTGEDLKLEIVEGQELRDNGTLTANVNRFYADAEINPNQNYLIKDFFSAYSLEKDPQYYAFLDADGKVIKINNKIGKFYGIALIQAKDIPSNAVKIRIGGLINYKSNARVITNVFTENENLYDGKTYITGGHIDFVNRKIQPHGNHEYIEEYIPVESGELYYFEEIYNVAFYDQYYRVLRSGGTFEGIKQVFEVPYGAKYMRLSGYVNKTNEKCYRLTQPTGEAVANIELSLSDKIDALDKNTTYTITQYTSNDPLDIQYDESKIVKEGKLPESKELNESLYFDLDKNKSYLFELSINFKGNNMVLDQLQVQTNQSYEIIRTSGDFKKIMLNPYGKFLVTEDIEITSSANLGNLYLQGELDLAGHTLTFSSDVKLFNIGEFGVVKNGIFEFRNEELEDGKFMNMNNTGVFEYNFGKIENIIIQISSDIIVNNALLIKNHYGTIQNFVVYNDANVKLRNAGILAYTVYGNVQDGYISSGKNGKFYANYSVDFNVYSGLVSHDSDAGAKLENVFIVSDLYQTDNSQNQTGLIIGKSSNIILKNVYVVGDLYNYRIEKQGDISYYIPTYDVRTSNNPLSSYPEYTNTKFNDLYYFSSYEYDKLIGKQQDFPILNNVDWQERILNGNGQFEVKEMIELGYYPRVKLPSYMMGNQRYINLPNYSDMTKPELVDIKVLEQNREDALVQFTFNNEGGFEITDIKVQYLSNFSLTQRKEGKQLIVEVRFNRPEYYYSEYAIESIEFKKGNAGSSYKTDRKVPVEFYKEVNTVEDWSNIGANTTTLGQNYHINQDIDFLMANDRYHTISDKFTGKIDGGIYDQNNQLIGRHKLMNQTIPSNKYGMFYETYYAEFKNLDIVNLKGSGTIRSAFIRDLYLSKIDNVHINNAEIELSGITSNFGFLAGDSRYSTISNSSVSNSHITKVDSNKINLGGLIGNLINSNLLNSYASQIEIKANDTQILPSEEFGIGGLIGVVNISNIKNSYATGSIETSGGNGGGLIGFVQGRVNIDNAYAMVDIETNKGYVGGIFGRVNNHTIGSGILSLGNLITDNATAESMHRMVGNQISSPNYVRNFYAYENQTLNGNPFDGRDDAHVLVSLNDLSSEYFYQYDIAYPQDFDTSYVADGVLPQLRNANSGDLMPYQNEISLGSSDLELNNITANRIGENFKVRFDVKKSDYTISNVIIDGMNSTFDIKDNGDSYYVEVNAAKTSAFDLYKLVVEFTSKSGRKVEKSAMLDFGGPVYWEITNVNEWIERLGKNGQNRENFKIKGMLDFTGYDNLPQNLVVNRLIGDENVESGVKNYSFTVKNDKNRTIFSNVITEITSLKFESINLQYGKGYKLAENFGFFNKVEGNIKDISINHFTLDLKPEHAISIGFFGRVYGNIENVKMSDFNITVEDSDSSSSKIGGLIGSMDGSMQNIEAENITITAVNSPIIGGIVGYAEKKNVAFVKNEKIKVSSVKINCGDNINKSTLNSDSVGGVIGHIHFGDITEIVAEHVEVAGSKNVGGIIGNNDGSNISDVEVEYATVTGVEMVGGYVGRNASGTADKIKVSVSNIKGKKRVGGVLGWTNAQVIRSFSISNKIDGLNVVGGFSGSFGGNGKKYNNYVIDCTVSRTDKSPIEGENYGIGGFAGYSEAEVYGNGVINSTVSSVGDYVGGFIGTARWHDSGYSHRNNYVLNSYVSGIDYVGGYAGKVSTRIAGSVTNAEVNGNDHVSGFIGELHISDKDKDFGLSNNYSSSNVVGNNHVGGFVGKVSNGVNGEVFVNPDRVLGNLFMGSLEVANDGIVDLFAGENTTTNEISIGSYFVYEGISVMKGGNIEDIAQMKLPNGSNNRLVKAEELNDKTFYNKKISDNGMGFGSSVAGFTNYFITDAVVQMEKPSLIPTKLSNDGTISQYKLELPSLEDGNYQIYVYDLSENGMRNLNTEAISVVNHQAVLSVESNDSVYFEIVDENTVIANGIAEQSENIYTNILASKETENGLVQLDSRYSDQPIHVQINGVDGSAKIEWYRSNGNYYDDKNATLVSNSNETEVRIATRGYYYAKIIDGSSEYYTQIYCVDTTSFMPYPTQKDQEPLYSEGFDKNGNPYNTTDKWYDGGIPIPKSYLPTNPVFLNLESERETRLPRLNVYASDVDKINFEFDSSLSFDDEGNGSVYMKITQGSQVIFEGSPTQRVMSLSYDYRSPLTVVLSNGYHVSEQVYSALDVRKSISLYGKDYYYIKDEGVGINQEEELSGNFVHIYEDKALDVAGNIYDLKDSVKIGEVDGIKVIETKPLRTVQMDGKIIHVYAHFTLIKQGDSSVARESQLLVKKNKILALDPSMGNYSDGLIWDRYQNNEYITVLKNQQLVDFMSKINYSKDFKNSNISEMTNNLDSELPYALIRYMNGNVVLLNYLSGEIIELEGLTSSMSFGEYVGDIIDGFFNGNGKLNENSEYSDASSLLEEMSEEPSLGGEIIESYETLEEETLETSEESQEEEFAEEVDGKSNADGTSLAEGESNANGDSFADGEDISMEDETSMTDQNLEDEVEKETIEKSDIDQQEEIDDTVSEKEEGIIYDDAITPTSLNRYMLAYNPKTKQYEVYQSQDYLSLDEDVQSMNEKVEILQNYGIEIRMKQNTVSIVEKEENTGVRGIWIFVMIALAILALLGYNVRKQRN